MCDCCKVFKFKEKKWKWKIPKGKKKKAGFILYDENEDKMLIVNSYGKWGHPKGSLELNESNKQAALRELLEETGIKLSITYQIRRNRIRIFNTYYWFVYYNSKEHERYLSNLSEDVDLDINALCWVSLKCAHKFDLNSHFKSSIKILKKKN